MTTVLAATVDEQTGFAQVRLNEQFEAIVRFTTGDKQRAIQLDEAPTLELAEIIANVEPDSIEMPDGCKVKVAPWQSGNTLFVKIRWGKPGDYSAPLVFRPDELLKEIGPHLMDKLVLSAAKNML